MIGKTERFPGRRARERIAVAPMRRRSWYTREVCEREYLRKGGSSIKIIHYDICAIPLFLMILFVCHSRRMTKGMANRLFITLVCLSLISAITDLGMEIADNMVPLSETGRILCCAFTYIYLALRNATNAVLLLFLLALTRTTFLIRKTWVKVLFCLPYALILVMLVQNPFTHNVFTITAQAGYSRGPLILVLYGTALLYGVVGFVYCVYCRRYLPTDKWVALLGIYLLEHIAVVIQFFHPELLVEMICTAAGEMLVMLSIMRPEERMDSDVGMLSWASYQSDLRNILLSGERVQIIVIRMQNCREIHNYLGEHRYNAYISEIAGGIRDIHWNHEYGVELYFERPGTIYLIADEGCSESDGERLLSEISDRVKRHTDMGVCFEPRVCLIRCPDDLRNAEDIISLGHKFHKMGQRNQTAFLAGGIVQSQTFAIEAHINEIIDRAIQENHIEMYYQPIYDVRTGRFCSAEALARIIDPAYGFISPGIFIPAAEALGFIIPIGDAVLDQVFRFVAGHDMEALGLSYIELNLSVAQCMERDLPEKIQNLQEKYGVDPRYINLEITETTFENISEVVYENAHRLIQMGYSFALDDYGIGYSNIQRVNHLPLKLIKIDKSMLDEVSSENGRMILQYTVRMMQSIGKQLVVEGAETRDVIRILEDMGCDYIQGFYFSRPLPADDFIRFIEEDNGQRNMKEDAL